MGQGIGCPVHEGVIAGPVAQNGAYRADELDGQDLAVDRNPEPEDEDPASGGQGKADGASQNAGLPDVVPAGAGHDGDQGGVDDHLEEEEDAADDDGGDEVAVGEEPPRGEGEEA